MCNLLITKHSLCGCTTTLHTSYCGIQRNNPHKCASITSVTTATFPRLSPVMSIAGTKCPCIAPKITLRTVNHQCGCHSWEDLYKREDKIARAREKEKMYRQMEKLERKREREMMEYREMEREEREDSGTGGLLSPDTEDEERGNGRNRGKVAVEDAESEGDMEREMGDGGTEMSVDSVEN